MLIFYGFLYEQRLGSFYAHIKGFDIYNWVINFSREILSKTLETTVIFQFI
jgi:hypothetical protein